VAHLTAHAIADVISLLVRVVAGLRHRSTQTVKPHTGADKGKEVEECGTSRRLQGHFCGLVGVSSCCGTRE
jgi:hypothetical protein